MASTGRKARRNQGRSGKAIGSLGGVSLPSFSTSWSAIGTIAVSLIFSYLGCKPPPDFNPTTASGNPTWNATEASNGSLTSSIDPSSTGSPSVASSNPFGNPIAATERDSIIIGAFNIQTFGRTKMSRPEVVEILVDIARRFDILAVQELRDNQEGTIPEFLRRINAEGARYQAVVSPRIFYGTGNHSEQLVYIYDSDQIEILSAPYVAADPRKSMFRPPYVGHFRYRSRYPEEAFSFVLMNVHTSPQHTAAEFAALEEMIPQVMRNHSTEDDFILLGDLNEEPGRFIRYRWMENQYAAILSHWKTNTAETKNYDNIIFDHRRTAEFTGEAGVLNLRTYYQLTREQADRVSDHMPVWATFSTREVQSGAFTQQTPVIR